jgi:hypothetical protein
VINEAFARHYLPNVDPLATTSPVVGIVKDVKLFSVKGDVGPVMFLASLQPDRIGALQVRAAGNPEALASAIREAIQTVNPRLFTSLHTLGEGMSRTIAKEKMVAASAGSSVCSASCSPAWASSESPRMPSLSGRGNWGSAGHSAPAAGPSSASPCVARLWS